MQSVVVSMALFALVGGITPGPVNVLAANLGARSGWGGAWSHVLGASIAYGFMVWLMGAGLHQVLERAPGITTTIQWLGAGYLLYLGVRIATAAPMGGGTPAAAAISGQSNWRRASGGFLTQALNPKGWLVSMSGVALFVAGAPAEGLYLAVFCGVSFIVCFMAVSVWAVIGVFIGEWLDGAHNQRWFNRLCGLALALCVWPMLGGA